MGWFRGAMLVGLFISLLPVISVLTAAGLAHAACCALDEGSAHPCFIAGHDIGEALYVMAVSGWFGLVTLPYALAIILLWALVEIVCFGRRRAK